MNDPASPLHACVGVPQLALSGTIEPTRLSLAYRCGLVVVAIAMLLLPLLYLGLIVLVGATVWWHLTTNTWILQVRGASQLRAILYAAPAVMGLVLVFFMIKPILARPARRRELLRIAPEEEPRLFAFIEQICTQVRAPVPRRVQVDCQVNASAGFIPGGPGPLTRDLVLTIGLPLAAALSVRELGGVLAHEFGHFAQGGGMRLTALVRGINGWFGRVVYERDEWDETLERWSREASWQFSIMLTASRGAVWASRRVLNGLMLAGHAISCFLTRQMEYDADSYEIKFAGSDAFARTSARLRELSLGSRFGYNDLREGLRTRTLPANLPVFLTERSGHLPDELLSQVRRVPDGATAVFDTHPSDADRVRAAALAAAPGVLVGGDGPATQLSRDFETLSAAATRHHYEHDLGLSLEALTFVGTDVAIRESRSREESGRAIGAFLGERASVYRPLHLRIAELQPLTPTELWSALVRARDAMAAFDQLSPEYRRFDALELRRERASAAQELLRAGFDKVDPADFDLTHGTLEEATATEAHALEEQRGLTPVLERFEEAATRRLSCGLALTAHTPDEDSAAREARWSETLSLVEAFNAVAGVMPELHQLRRLLLVESVVEHNQSASGQPEQLQRRLTDVRRSIDAHVNRLRSRVSGVPCPRAFSVAPVDVATWCGLAAPGQPAHLSSAIDGLVSLYFGALGRLASIALQADARGAVLVAPE